jgi:carboxypeptidase C (cathepsin A)
MMNRLLLLLGATILLANAAKQDHLVQTKDLPGGIKPEWIKSKWYSGHYNVSKTRDLHYLFIESHYHPEKDPVIVFMNGGPGLASIHLAFTGIGPVFLRSDVGFIEIQASWCNNASVLFLDNPAGTGYSWADRYFDFFGNDYH